MILYPPPPHLFPRKACIFFNFLLKDSNARLMHTTLTCLGYHLLEEREAEAGYYNPLNNSGMSKPSTNDK